jgi:hypothetical protein
MSPEAPTDAWNDRCMAQETTGEPGSHVPADRGERRWPMAAAVISVGILNAFLPSDFRLLPWWVFEIAIFSFLVVLIVGDPGRIDRDKRWLRYTTDGLIGLITFANAAAVVKLVTGVFGDTAFSDARDLLVIGAVVWLVNVIAFALWYWDLDAGGAAARAAAVPRTTRAFAFPESDLPEHADGRWYPKFVDYLAVSFNTATAFSPTDVSAVKPWAKLLMIAESMISLTVGILVLARAINIWPTS